MENEVVTFQLASDVHLEFRNGVFEIVPKTPYLALLGDIGLTSMANRLDDGDKNYSEGDRLEKWIEAQCAKFKEVYFIMGNHESYGRSTIDESVQFLQNLEKKLPNFYFFEKRVHYIPGTDVCILGTTLWSNIPESQRATARNCLNDFRQIKSFSIDDYKLAFEANVDWLQKTIAAEKSKNKRIVVFTHHCPINIRGAAPPSDDGYAFEIKMGIGCSDLTHLLQDVHTWCFGHTHWNLDVIVGNTRVVSNQVCYPKDPYFRENGCVQYDPEQVIEIGLPHKATDEKQSHEQCKID